MIYIFKTLIFFLSLKKYFIINFIIISYFNLMRFIIINKISNFYFKFQKNYKILKNNSLNIFHLLVFYIN